MSEPPLSPDVERLVNGMLASSEVRQELSAITSDAIEFVAEALAVLLPVMVDHGFDPDREHAEVLIAVTLGWMLGLGVPHQDHMARLACIEARLAILRRAAEQSARVNAQVELRHLH